MKRIKLRKRFEVLEIVRRKNSAAGNPSFDLKLFDGITCHAARTAANSPAGYQITSETKVMNAKYYINNKGLIIIESFEE